MSTNVYGPQNGPAPDFLRNTYDKQFQNLITTNFGELRPCFCKEVLPGDSINIDPVVAIRSQPIIFPIQTRMKFYCHFFYGRNRILYKDWEDFIFQTKDGLTPPLLKLTEERAKKMISTGSLGDNLGVVSTLIPQNNLNFEYNCSKFILQPTTDVPLVFTDDSFLSYVLAIRTEIEYERYKFDLGVNAPDSNTLTIALVSDSISSPLVQQISSKPFLTTAAAETSNDSDFAICLLDLGVSTPAAGDDVKFISECFHVTVSNTLSEGSAVVNYTLSDADFATLSAIADAHLAQGNSYNLCIFTMPRDNDMKIESNPPFIPVVADSSSLVPSKFLMHVADEGSIYDATDSRFVGSNKFVGNNPSIPLSALPFRLYEFICNYYYRNDTNNPYVLNGEPQYNCFIPTTDGDWDTNEYLIHHRNWESDMFTTCVPSPQFGTAPLVGLSYNGGLTADVTTSVTDSDGNTQNLSIKVGVDDEGNISNIFNADTGVPSGSLKALMDAMSTTGISINTLRNVNSFQRFLENVIRRGLRYRNQLLSHFGVSVDYPDIDIPQFIGGFSGDLVVREVTNMVETSNVALGDVAGKIDAVIQSNHSINCYCAEHGFIMGIFSIVPVPTYSQVLPHMFTRYSPFDYFQKEFDKIGYVPVTYRNFLPLQADNPDETFGYQRAHYEYMSSLDEVHGDFRMTLDDFVLYRLFKEKPTLNANFLQVYHDSLNNIFAVDNVEGKYKDADKFLLQFYFQYSQKTMIPKHGVASLE